VEVKALHGMLEALPLLLFIVAGFSLDRWVSARKARYLFYAALLLTAFIFDLNKVSFRVSPLNILFYSLILAVISELLWICARKKGRLLMGGALVIFVPFFVYAYFALLMLLPFPCHVDKKAIKGEFKCGEREYVLRKRLSFDVFNPAQVYILTRNLRRTPLLRQVDKFPAPKGYLEAEFTPIWQCHNDGVKVDLEIDGYTLWSLKDKPNED
jgi:hypothetical protein